MGLPHAQHLEKLIKDNHAIELKYIQWHWQFVHAVDWDTQVIEYASNGEILPAIQQYFSELHEQIIQRGKSNDANITSRGAVSILQLQTSNAGQDREHELEIDNKAPGLHFLLDP